MKYIPFVILILLSGCSWRKQPKGSDCARFKTGVFLVKETNGRIETKITRTEDFQTEEHSPTKSKSTFRVIWLDDCTYKLKKLSTDIKGVPIKDVTVHIVETRSDSYLIEATLEGNYFYLYQGEVIATSKDKKLPI
jgi:hypothetical protein